MKPIAEIWRDDPDLALDLLEERAALIEDGEGCSRYIAELTAAHAAGFESYLDAYFKIKTRRKEIRDGT